MIGGRCGTHNLRRSLRTGYDGEMANERIGRGHQLVLSLTPPPGSAFTRLLLFPGASHHHQCLDRILLTHPTTGSAFTRLLLFRGASHHHQCLDRILLLGHLTACVHLTFIFFNFYFNFFPRMSGLRLLRIGAGHADAVIFGRPFIGNPDLPARLTNGWELAESDASLWYSASEAGPWGSTHSPPHSQEVPLLTPSSISSLSPPIVGSRMSRVHLCEALIGRANTYTDVIGRHTRM